jgi:hypothetical protein
LDEFGRWLETCLQEPAFFDDIEARKQEFHGQLESVRKALLVNYKSQVKKLMLEGYYLMDRLRRDPLVQKLSADVSSLVNHLFKDETGRVTIKPELLCDLQIILPVVLRKLRFVILPDIRHEEPDLKIELKNIMLNISELTPNHLHLSYLAEMPSGDLDVETGNVQDENSVLFEV